MFLNKGKRKNIITMAVAMGLSLSMSLSAFAIGPGEGMGSQGGSAIQNSDNDPWSGYTNLDGSAFSYLERGVSISKFQNEKGAINWSQVKNDGIDFAIIRAAYGLTEDVYFDQNVQGAQNAGIKVGAYLCSTAKNLDEAIAEANLMVKKIRKYNFSYPVAYDMEVKSMLSEGATPAQLTEMANKFCEIVAAAGYTPVVYANTNWLNNHLIVSRIPYDIWFAAYPTDKIYRPVSGTNTTIWQTGDSGIVKGIRGNVTTEFSKKAYGGGSPAMKYAGKTVTTAANPDEPFGFTSNPVQSAANPGGVIYSGSVTLSEGGPGAPAFPDGWNQDKDGKWFYYESGKAVKGWKQVKGYWYYFREDGSMVNGWVEVNGLWYFMGLEYGDMKTGWRYINDKWYYMEDSGAMLANTQKNINGVEYRFGESGAWIS